MCKETRRDWNHPDPGLHRFGDDVYSEIYGEALNYANNPILSAILDTETGLSTSY